jgi:hypothetical protein
MQNLAPTGTRGPNIRVGGNSADESAYVPAAEPLPEHATYRITDVDFLAYASAVPRWGGSLTLGLNFRSANASLAEAHVRGLAAALPGVWNSTLVEALEVGNECDLYPTNGYRSSSWTSADYNAEFGAVVAGLERAGVPARRIQGLTFCCSHFDADISPYLAEFAKTALSSVSYHTYSLSVCEGQKQTVPELLANVHLAHQLAHLAPLAHQTRAQGLPFNVGEGNTISCGGQSGVSDVFAAALWALDLLPSLSAIGVSRFNFHGCTQGPYTPIAYASDPAAADVPDVRPLYYGMWVFALATQDSAVMANVSVHASNPLVKAHAARAKDGTWRVLLVHKDVSAGAVQTVVQVQLPHGATGGGTLARLQAAGDAPAHAKSGITFAGQTFDKSDDGLPRGARVTEALTASAGELSFVLAPATAALLTIPCAP